MNQFKKRSIVKEIQNALGELRDDPASRMILQSVTQECPALLESNNPIVKELRRKLGGDHNVWNYVNVIEMAPCDRCGVVSEKDSMYKFLGERLCESCFELNE